VDSPPASELEVLRRAIDRLKGALPPQWDMESSQGGRGGPDAVVKVTAPDRRWVTLVVEAKRVIERTDVTALRERLETLTRGPAEQGMVVARYLSPPVRDRLVASGLSYVDATGNIRLESSSPGLFIDRTGADRDPWRAPGRPRGTLKGRPAAQIVRALVDFQGDWSMRELIEVSGASTGAAYRAIELLAAEGLVARKSDKRITVVEWPRLLRRWSEDYGFVRNSRITRWIAPRGLGHLMDRAATAPGPRYAITGTLAAAAWAPYAPARSAMIYAADATATAEAWGLRTAEESAANVLLAEPEIDVAFERSKINEVGATIAAPAQVVVDLMTGPGRSPSEAEELLRWMARNEEDWRQLSDWMVRNEQSWRD
jgi:hypothetical protein